MTGGGRKGHWCLDGKEWKRRSENQQGSEFREAWDLIPWSYAKVVSETRIQLLLSDSFTLEEGKAASVHTHTAVARILLHQLPLVPLYWEFIQYNYMQNQISSVLLLTPFLAISKTACKHSSKALNNTTILFIYVMARVCIVLERFLLACDY